MRAPWLVLLGALAYGAFLVAWLPASVVAREALAASAGQVRLAATTGTVWSGSARAILAPPGMAPLAVDRLAWRWQPSRLLAGEMAYAVDASAGATRAQAIAAHGFGGRELRDVQAQGEASALATFFPLVATWQPAGTVTLAAPRLALREGKLSGEATLDWKNAATSLSTVKPLGTYQARLRAEGGPATVTVTTLDGPLRLSGQASLAAAGRVSFTGEARAEPTQQQALEPLLGLLGVRRPDGAYAIDWRAR